MNLKTLLAAAGALTLMTRAAHAGTILFDGFESPQGTGISYGGTDDAGAVFGDGTGIQQNGSAFGYANAPEGTQTAHVQGTGSFTETVSGLVSGQGYTLSFEDAARYGYGVDPIAVSYEPVGEIDPAVLLTTPTTTTFNLVSQKFTYEGFSPVAEFTFAGVNPQIVPPNGTPVSGDYNAAIDAVTISTVSAVPEPSTWLLMIAGIGGIGLMLRRAKQTMGFRFKDAVSA